MSIQKSIVFLSLLLVSLGQTFAAIELNLQHSDQQGCAINLELTEMELENIEHEGVVYQRLPQTGFTAVANIGQAELNARTFSLEIPATAAVQFDLSSQIIEISDVTLWPQQLEEFRMEKPDEWQLDDEYYATDQFLPQEMVHISDPAIMRDNRLVQVSVVPFQYNPARRILRIHTDLLIDFTFSGVNTINQLTRQLPPSQSFDNLMTGNVINRDAWVEEQRDGDNYGLEPILFIYNSGALFYDLQDLIDWKREKGHVVYTATQSDMTLTNSGSVGQYIQGAFDNWELPPVHVVLVGDPSSCSFGRVAASTDDGDHDYACVAGDDILGDIFVSRMSVGEDNQLEAVVFKQLQYERTPYISDPSWFDSAHLVGDATPYTGMSAVFTNENIRYMMEEEGFSNVTTCYEHVPYNCTNQVQSIDSAFERGILYFNYRGYYGMSGWDNGYTDDLNNGFRTPFIVDITCGTGSFVSGTGLAEHFYRVGSSTLPKGGVAAIGTATLSTNTRCNNVVDTGIFGGIFIQGLTTAGAALFNGKYELWQSFQTVDSDLVDDFSEWNNLMGDASLQLWTGEPEVIVVTHENSLPASATALPVTVTRDGLPLADARVCIYQEGGIQSRALTAADGTVILPLDHQLTAGSATLTVSGKNIYPYQGSVTVSSESIFLDVSNYVLSDDNGDGLPNPGESCQMTVQLRNLGTSQTAYSINATLSSIDDRIAIQQDYSTYSNAGHGASVLCNTPYEFTISPTVLPDTDFDIDLSLDISCSAGNFTGVITLNLEQPLLQLTAVAADPDGNGRISQGENGDLLITLRNSGNIATGTCSATLTSSDPYVNVIDGIASFSSMAVEGSGTNTTPFVIQPASDAFSGQMIPFTLTLTSAAGIQLQHQLEVEVDEVEVWDPLGPVGGYYCFDNGDEFYTNHPLYDWVEISSSGTRILLTDDGDEEDDSHLLTLPFSFNYFDETYTQVTVCSNGWLAMGDQVDQVNFRNYPIPTSIGPAAMIAPFWDDLRVATSGSSQRVYYQYDAANHRYIVEWYQLLQVGPGSPTETFQVILYDQDYHDGDNGDILFQYYDITNNVNSSDTDNYYSTVGIENPTETDGIEYSYWNSYTSGARPLQSGLAILFTQRRGEYDTHDYSGPVINHTPSSFQTGQDSYPIQATISDMSNVSEASIFWSLNQSSWSEVAMSEQGGDLWRGYIPGHANGTVIYYYIYAVDGSTEANESTSSVYSFEVVDGGPPSGPDSYGYYISDWMDIDRVSYGWIDISGSGTPLNLGDDSGASVSLPFNFMFYGQNRTSIWVCSNGFAQFGDSDNTIYNTSLPNSYMGHMLVPFWHDLNPSSGGEVYYQSLPAQHIFVVSWVNVPYYSGGGSNTFQIVLYDQDYYGSVTGDGHIVFQYNDTNGYNSCTIGVQNGGTAVQYVYNNNYDSDALALSNGKALHITTGTEAVSPVDDLTIQLQGDNLFLNWSAADGAQSYHVYRSDSPYSGFSQLAETSDSNWLHTDGVVDGAGFYRVTANGGFRQELMLQNDPDSEQPREVPVLSRHGSSK
jgi:hypothetical protein